MIHIGHIDVTEPGTISIAQDITIHIQNEHLTVARAQWLAGMSTMIVLTLQVLAI